MNPYSDGAELRRFLQQFIAEHRKNHALAAPVGVSTKKRDQLQRTTKKRKTVENRWAESNDESGAVIFARRGRVSLMSLAQVLAICLFWDGGVSVFVGICVGAWIDDKYPLAVCWFLTIFLIPFILIGLMIFAVTAMTVLQNFCRYIITIDNMGVHYCRSWFGIGRARVWRHADIRQVSVLYNTKPPRMRDSIRNPELADTVNGVGNISDCYAVDFSISNATNKRLAANMIRDLHEREARTIAARIRTIQSPE